MIIEGPDQVTEAVLAEIARAPNPRFREVMSALVKHLHSFVREVKLSEEEFHQACAIINSIGQSSNSFHNEAVLASGSLGVSTLVCLLNNGKNGATETTASADPSATSPRVRIPAPFPRMSRLTPMTMPAAVAASSLGAISIDSAINSRSINRCTFGAGGAAPHLNSREHRSRAPCPSACGARYRESSEPGACFPSARLPRYAKAPTTIRSSA